MIKIIEWGTKQTVECEVCGCLFSYDIDDVLTEQEGPVTRTYIQKCPQCGRKVVLTETTPEPKKDANPYK